MTVETLEARLADIEAKLGEAETNEEWDQMEPELRKLRLDVWDAVEKDRAELSGAKAEMRRSFSWWDYVNPFDATARERYKRTISQKRIELEQEQTLEERLAQLVARFYADKTREHARELIRIAEKVQREVPGDWPAKAGAAYGAIVTGASGDAAIAMADEVRRAIAGRPAAEWSAIGAALLRGEGSAGTLSRILAGIDADELSGRVVGPALASGRGAEEAVSFVRAFREKQDGRAFDSDAILLSAGLLSAQTAEAAHASLSALEQAMPGDPDQRAVLAAGAYLGDVDRDAARTRVERFGVEMDDASIVAALLFSNAEDTDDARMLKNAARGSEAAVATLVAAGLLADVAIDETVAFVQHVQQQLTGTWESEALVMAGGILAGERSTPRVKAAFLIADLFVRDHA